MKTCWICGTENPDTALRCSFCGIELDMNMKHTPLPKGKGDQGYKPETAPGRAPRPKESRERKRSDRGAVLTLSFTSLTLILTALLVLGSSVFEGVKLLRHFGEDLESTINYYEPVEEEDFEEDVNSVIEYFENDFVDDMEEIGIETEEFLNDVWSDFEDCMNSENEK